MAKVNRSRFITQGN